MRRVRHHRRRIDKNPQLCEVIVELLVQRWSWARRSTSAIPAHPGSSPWQRGSNENANGLLRQYFPKGTILNAYPAEHLRAVEREINNRPRHDMYSETEAPQNYSPPC
jgi:IS30 family transposase